MTGLYVGSTAPYSGKNLFIAALGLTFQRQGLKVGYMKPVGAATDATDQSVPDRDAAFMQSVFGLDQDPAKVTPVAVTSQFLAKAFAQGCGDMAVRISEAYRELSDGKDVMLIGGSGSLLYAGKYCGMEGASVAKMLGAKVVLVDRWGVDRLNYDYVLAAKEQLGDALAGVAFTDVPEAHVDETRGFLQPFLERRGVPVLAIVPRDTFVGGISIRDLALGLDARVISADHNLEGIIEHVLIGTMQVENFRVHFRRRPNAVVVVGGDRSDIQLVALEGGCPCLVLTGNLYPNGMILGRAEALNKPILVAKEDTYTVARRIGEVMASQKFRDKAKIQRGVDLVTSCLDKETLLGQMGLSAG